MADSAHAYQESFGLPCVSIPQAATEMPSICQSWSAPRGVDTGQAARLAIRRDCVIAQLRRGGLFLMPGRVVSLAMRLVGASMHG